MSTRSPNRLSFLLLGSVLSLTSAARGEDLAPPPAQPALTVGSKVRLRAPAVGRIEGIVIGMEDAFLQVRTNDRGPLKVSRDAISEIEVGVGRRRRTVKGLFVGAAIGGTTAALAACCSLGASNPGSDRAEAIGAGLAWGATLGAATGYFIKSERWTSLPLERVRVSVAASRKGGVSLSFGLSF
jgi:hypothetical protein